MTYQQIIEYCRKLTIPELIKFKEIYKNYKSKEYLVASVVLEIRMKQRMKFSYSKDKNIIVVDSINILTILNFLREGSFIIEEMRDLDNNLIYRDDGKGF